MEGFEFISTKLKDTYTLLTGGGDAELEMLDNSDPFKSGVKISVKPRKTWSDISLLSGG